ncbi:MAG: hypothetical protein GXP25_21995 [Planctomycetes bacterium]|nr:hypothetical protein [Planctomycetota bacterium]
MHLPSRPGLKPGGGRPGWKPGQGPNRPGRWPSRPGYWHGYGPTYNVHYRGRYHWYHCGYRPWAWATWGGVCAWIGYTSRPVYYNYVVVDGAVYNGETEVAPAADYAEQATEIADAAQPTAEDVDWMPLGIFGVTPKQGDEVQVTVQLAATKDGTIGGTYENTAENVVLALQGSIDKTTQRAAWKVGEEDAIVMETGLDNLTKDVSTVLLHFPGGVTEAWVMTRMDKETAKKMEAVVEGNTKLRKELAESARQLEGTLDDLWKSYLALPNEVFEGDDVPDVEALKKALGHFDLAKGNEQCREMVEKPEFQKTRELLERYIKELSS